MIELFAAEPDIVTPTGIAVDATGAVLVIECHTHFPPQNYKGLPADRIRRFEDTDGDGRADRITTVLEGTRWTMNLALDDQERLYVATRDEIFRLPKAAAGQERTPIVRMESKGNYPHNGLSGFAFDHEGNVYFGMGENLGVPYKLIGSDGSTVSGSEGGHIFRCSADGGHLERWATGFWNPFHLALDPLERLFAVDNDPDSRPPCRLLHIVPGGNYGYKFRNGRSGLHPFTAWNGENPGTLPMVAGTGEAPSGIVAYRSSNLPEDYDGQLLVTSWGDHRLDRFELETQGASFRSVGKPFVTGGENFRPVGIAVAPDGSLFISDWVDRSYEVHGKGRIWHVRARQPAARPTQPNPTPAELRKAIAQPRQDPWLAALAVQRLGIDAAELNGLLDSNQPAPVLAAALRRVHDRALLPRLWRACDEADPFIQQAARRAIGGLKVVTGDFDAAGLNADGRLAALLVLRETDQAPGELLRKSLIDLDPRVRFVTVQWIGEEKLTDYRSQLDGVLTAGPVSEQLFGAYLAALERLEGGANHKDEWSGQQYMARALVDPKSPLAVRIWALRALDPNHPALTVALIEGLIAGSDPALRREAVRSLRSGQHAQRAAILLGIAGNPAAGDELRAESLVGLDSGSSEARALLVALAQGESPVLRHEALRSLAGATLEPAQRDALAAAGQKYPDSADLAARVLDPTHPAGRPPATDTAAWLKLLAGPADAAEGERVFFHARSAGCFRCHAIDGRGGRIGPDLLATGRTLDRRRLVESILEPSREVAPQFVTWQIETHDGRALSGMLLREAVDGTQTFVDQQGQTFALHPRDIAERKAQTRSVMPDGLEKLMTLQELRDLLAFLQQKPAD